MNLRLHSVVLGLRVIARQQCREENHIVIPYVLSGAKDDVE
jgi:hypothetical protein